MTQVPPTVEAALAAPAQDARDAVFGALYDVACADPNVIVLTADTGAMKFRDFERDIPDQLINVGVAEQNAISVAAGLTLAGKRVCVYGIASFLILRALEQIKVDLCIPNLPVTLLASGTGYVYSADNSTHHVVEDIAALRALPNLTLWSPSDFTSAAAFVHAALSADGPSHIRFDKGPFDDFHTGQTDFSPGVSVVRPVPAGGLVVLGTGIATTMAARALDAIADSAPPIGLVDVYRLKPLSPVQLWEAVSDAKHIVTLEEHTVAGGLGGLVCEALAEIGAPVPVTRLGVRDRYHTVAGDREHLRSLDGIDIASLRETFARLASECVAVETP